MKRKFLLIAVIGTLLLGSVTVMYSATGDSCSDAANLQAERKEARRVGLPTTMDEVVVGSIDDSRNAAPLIVEAASLLESEPAIALDKLTQASRMPSCDFDWKKAQKPDFWKHIRFQDCIHALLASATKKFEGGDSGGGRRTLLVAHNLINLVSTYPTQEALKQSVLAERALYGRMGGLMVENPKDMLLLPAVQAETITPRSTKVILNALRDFVAAGNESGRSKSAGPVQAFATMFNKRTYPLDPWGPASVEATHLAGARDLMQALDEDSDWIRVRSTIDKFADKWMADKRQSAYTLRQAAPSLQVLARLLAENEAARRVLFVAAAAFRYKADNQQFPKESPVIGTTSSDPFTSEPLHYQQVGLGFEVHSVGADGLDSGGSVREGMTIDRDVSFYFKGDAKT
ncbi:MAG TPA: hypothetical protein VNI20_00330 [Fimbriimonadaceae bacterium]|nr:hypothetical protein [Fimbriimonadaceae bacterium]